MKFLDKDPETAKSATFQAGRIRMQMQMQKSLDPYPDSSNPDPKHYNVKECVARPPSALGEAAEALGDVV